MNSASPGELQDVLQKMRSALTAVTDDNVRDALLSGIRLLSCGSPGRAGGSPPSAGSIDHTFMDEAYEPYGREIDVRIYYSWEDYDRADEPLAVWGAQIENVEVLAVRYLDDEGNEVGWESHRRDLAWQLVMNEEELFTERCTADGYRNGCGSSHPLYTPPSAARTEGSRNVSVKLARSQPTRVVESERRGLG